MRSFVVLTLSLLLVSCDDDPRPVQDVVVSFAAGQRWTYDLTSVTKDSSGTILTTWHDSLEVWVGSTDDSVFGLAGLVRLEARSLFGDRPSSGTSSDTQRVWYRVSTSAVVEVAYQNASGFVALLKRTSSSIRHIGRRFFDPIPWSGGAASDGPPQRSTEERVVLMYPLVVNASWVSFTDPFPESRTVEAIEEVNIPAGKFTTARIRTSLQFGDEPFVF